MLRSDYTNCIWSENTTIHDAFWDSTDRSFIDVGFLPCTEIIIGIHFCRPFLSSKKWTQHYWPVKEARLLQRLSNAIRKIEQQGKQVWFSYAFSLNINSVKTRYSELKLASRTSSPWARDCAWRLASKSVHSEANFETSFISHAIKSVELRCW